jgi:threonine aldolase
MSLPREFRSDNAAPVHPAVLEAIAEANHGSAGAYGNDPWTTRARDWIKMQFGDEADAFLVWNGTGANVTSLRAMTRPWQAVITSEHAHINVDECGAPELLAGVKLIDLPSPDGKLTPEEIEEAATRGVGSEHHVQPAVVSISESTEYGTVYGLEELAALSETVHQHGLLLHVDGARLANASAALRMPLRELTADVGVDLLSFGLTKNGAMTAEAVVVFDPALAAPLKYIRKQNTQLASKMRYLAAQFVAMAEGDLWLRNAMHANAMAARLAEGITTVPGVEITQAVEANAVFALLPEGMTDRLQRDFHFYVWNEVTGEVRLMTNWATAEADVDELVSAMLGTW